MGDFTEFVICLRNSTDKDVFRYTALCVCICLLMCCCCLHSIVWFVLLRRVKREEEKMKIFGAVDLFSGGNIKPSGYKKVLTVGRELF